MVLHIDDFGNIISNILAEDLEDAGFHAGDSLLVTLGSKTLTTVFCSVYGQVPVGESLALIGGSSFLEVAVNQGSAATVFDAKVGETFRVSGVASS